jgi:hypothetical protein
MATICRLQALTQWVIHETRPPVIDTSFFIENTVIMTAKLADYLGDVG